MIQLGTKNYINTVVESGQLVGIYLSVLSFVVLFLQKLDIKEEIIILWSMKESFGGSLRWPSEPFWENPVPVVGSPVA